MTKFETALKKYLAIFESQEMYFVNDLKNLELFKKTPGNKSAEDIRTKISAVNDKEISDLGLMESMVSHILKLNIDDRLQKNDLTVVEAIATLTIGDKCTTFFTLLRFTATFTSQTLIQFIATNTWNFIASILPIISCSWILTN